MNFSEGLNRFLEFILFSVSFLVCVFASFLSKIHFIKRSFLHITLLSAGFMLAAQLLDFIPHMIPHQHGAGHHHHHDEGHKHHHDDHFHRDMNAGFFSTGISFIILIGIDNIVLKHNHCTDGEKDGGHAHDHSHSHHSTEKTFIDLAHDIEKTAELIKDKELLADEDDHLGCCNMDYIKYSTSKKQAFIYILSISVHSFFEGLAFKKGQECDKLFLTITIHKVLESLAIGLTLFSTSFSSFTKYGLAAFYSLLTPLGVLFAKMKGDSTFCNFSLAPIFNGLALGSIMFIVCIEMIPSCFHKPGNNKIKVVTLSIGYMLTSIFLMKTHGHHH